MNKPERIEQLRKLQLEADRIRKQLGISGPGFIRYQAELANYNQVIVEADGFGGATAMVVDGNFPIDYLPIFEKFFSNEDEALMAVDLIVSGSSDALETLGTNLS